MLQWQSSLVVKWDRIGSHFTLHERIHTKQIQSLLPVKPLLLPISQTRLYLQIPKWTCCVCRPVHGIHMHQICSLSQYSLFWSVCRICALCCSEVLWLTFKYIGFSLSIFCIEKKCCSAFSQGKESRSLHVMTSHVFLVWHKSKDFLRSHLMIRLVPFVTYKLTSYGITER